MSLFHYSPLLTPKSGVFMTGAAGRLLKTCGVSFLVNFGLEVSLSVVSEESSPGKETVLLSWSAPDDLLVSSILLLLLLLPVRRRERKKERGEEMKQFP